MPINEYKCLQCGEVFEARTIQYKKRARCPVCGGLSLKMISENVTAVFKGPGFYATDYKEKK